MKAQRQKGKNRPSTVLRGRGNLFADIGFEASQATELTVKAELTRQIYLRVKMLGLTQIQASQRLGISQPDVSKLMNARFTGFSTDRLIALLNILEVDVDIVVRPRRIARHREPGIVRVLNQPSAA